MSTERPVRGISFIEYAAFTKIVITRQIDTARGRYSLPPTAFIGNRAGLRPVIS